MNSPQALFIGLVLTVLATGCASNIGGYTKASEAEARLVGMTELEVIQRLGAPENEVLISNGRAWTYSGTTPTLAGGTCRVSLTIVEGVVDTAIVMSHDLSWVSFPLGGCKTIISRLD